MRKDGDNQSMTKKYGLGEEDTEFNERNTPQSQSTESQEDAPDPPLPPNYLKKRWRHSRPAIRSRELPWTTNAQQIQQMAYHI